MPYVVMLKSLRDDRQVIHMSPPYMHKENADKAFVIVQRAICNKNWVFNRRLNVHTFSDELCLLVELVR